MELDIDNSLHWRCSQSPHEASVSCFGRGSWESAGVLHLLVPAWLPLLTSHCLICFSSRTNSLSNGFVINPATQRDWLERHHSRSEIILDHWPLTQNRVSLRVRKPEPLSQLRFGCNPAPRRRDSRMIDVGVLTWPKEARVARVGKRRGTSQTVEAVR